MFLNFRGAKKRRGAALPSTPRLSATRKASRTRTNGDEEIAWEVGSGRLVDDAVLYDLRHLVG